MTGPSPRADRPAHPDDSRRRRRPRRWAVGVAATALAGIGLTAAVVTVGERGTGFCSAMDALPAIDDDLADDGSPSTPLQRYADALAAAADHAPDDTTAARLRELSDWHNRLSDAVDRDGASTAQGELSVLGLLADPERPTDAERTVDEAYRQHCR